MGKLPPDHPPRGRRTPRCVAVGSRLFVATIIVGLFMFASSGASSAHASTLKPKRCVPSKNANLVHCDFIGRVLVGANFKGSNLTGSHFDRANLTSAIFDGANLTDVDFESARMELVSLEHAELIDADIAKANLGGASLDYVGSGGITGRGLDSP